MNYKYLFKLSKSYIKFHKKLFLPLTITIFLSTFLLTSTFIIKDSYDSYSIKLIEKTSGDWDVKSSPALLKSNGDFSDNLEILAYENPLPLRHKDSDDSFFKEISIFDNTLPITLKKGKYPEKANEVLIEEPFAKSESYNLGDIIKFSEDSGSVKEFVVSGIFNKNSWFPSNYFYTLMQKDDYPNAFSVYTKIKTSSNINFLSNYSEGSDFSLNAELVNIKYRNDQPFDKVYRIFIIFVFLCAFLFIYNASSMYLKKKKAELFKLSTLGATKSQIRSILIIEFFMFSSVIFLASLLLSLLFWYLFLTFASTALLYALNLSFGLDYDLSIRHLVLLIFMNLIIFMASFMIALIKNRKIKHRKLRYRKLNLRRLPITWNLAITDMLRTGYGYIIVLMLLIVTIFFNTTQFVVENWVANAKSLRSYNTNVNINMDLFDKTDVELDKIINNIQDVGDESKESFTFHYGIQAVARLGSIEINTIYAVDDRTYENLVSKNDVDGTKAILLSNTTSALDYDNKVTFDILNKWQETLDSIDIDVQKVDQVTLENIDYSDSGYILILPKQMILDFMNKYPSTYISGSIYINGDHSTEVANLLENSLKLENGDHLYVLNNVETMQQLMRDTNAIRIFIYSFNMTAILVCLFLIQNLLSQYYENKKHDIYLLHVSGMTRKKIRRQYINQSIIYTLTVLICSAVLEVLFYLVINMFLSFQISIIEFLKTYAIYCLLLMSVMILLSRTTLKKYIKF